MTTLRAIPTRRVRRPITLTPDQCSFVSSAVALLPPPQRPAFVAGFEAKLRESASISDVLVADIVDGIFGQSNEELLCDD
jgi:hypothetical protein